MKPGLCLGASAQPGFHPGYNCYDFAAELADQYLVMERGEIVQSGKGEHMGTDGVRQRMSI